MTVVVPVYNDQKYIQKTLKSLSDQSHTNLQILVIDDHSSDNSRMLIKECIQLDSRFQLIENTVTTGVSNARNIGIDLAEGEFITFVDGDDIVSETYVEDLLLHADETVLSQIEFNYCDADKTILYSELNDSVIQYQIEKNVYKIPQMKLLNIIISFNKIINGSVNTKLFSMRIINSKKLRFDSSISVGEDLLFCIQYIKHIDYVFLYLKYDYTYTINAESVMRSRDKIYYFDDRWLTEVSALDRIKNELVYVEDDLLINKISARQALAAGVLYKKIFQFYDYESERRHLKMVFSANYLPFLKSNKVPFKSKVFYTLLFFLPPLYNILKHHKRK